MKIFTGIIIPFLAFLPLVCLSSFVAVAGSTSVIQQKQPNLPNNEKCFTEASGKKICAGHPDSATVDFVVNKAKKTITAKASLTFHSELQSAKAFFFLQQPVIKAVLNGKIIRAERRKAPGNEDWIIVVPVEPGNQVNKLELEYNISGLTAWGLKWEPFHWLTDYSDSTDARFSNVFAPVAFEADRYPVTYNFSFIGLIKPLNLYSSAFQTKIGPVIVKQKKINQVYKLLFSKHNNMAGPYFEFTSQVYHTVTFNYIGLYQPVPVTIYFSPSILKGKEEAVIRQAENLVRQTFDKFETTIGEYPFEKLLVKLYSLQNGDLPLSQEYSMEYTGAVVSRMELIPHEICHQWFGRGASPVDGTAGFVDELICDWYDYANPVKYPGKRKPVIISQPNSFSLRTPEESYQEGVFLAEISHLYKHHNINLSNILKRFYNKYRLKSYSREDFFNILSEDYPGSLQPYFLRYVFGKK